MMRSGAAARTLATLRRTMAGGSGLLLLGGSLLGPAPVAAGDAVAEPAEPAPVVWTGDAIERPLSARPGDAERGRAIVASRQTGLCLLCHPLTSRPDPLSGNLAPPLAGAADRLGVARLRARLVDSRRIEATSIMPAYHVVMPAGGDNDAAPPGRAETRDVMSAGAAPQRPAPSLAAPPRPMRVAKAWQGRSLLDGQQIEDVIAYLFTLREPS